MAELCEQELTVENKAAEASKPAFLLGYYNYTVVLTYIGMLVGFSGVLLAAKKQKHIGNTSLCKTRCVPSLSRICTEQKNLYRNQN